MTVAVILPSRARPEKLLAAIANADEMATRDDTVIVAALDEDDFNLPQKPATKHPLIWSVAPREDSLGAKYNRAADLAPDAISLLFTDDIAFDTQGYDAIVETDAAEFRDGYGVIGYGTQPWANVAVTIAMTPKMRKWIGYFMPPYFPAWWHETWIEELGYYMGRYLRSQAFNCAEVGGRGVTTGLRNVPMWGKFYQATRVLREDMAIRFLRENSGTVLASLDDEVAADHFERCFQPLREYFARRSAPNADPVMGRQLEQMFGTAPINDERHTRLIDQAQRVMVEVDRIQRRRDDVILEAAAFVR